MGRSAFNFGKGNLSSGFQDRGKSAEQATELADTFLREWEALGDEGDPQDLFEDISGRSGSSFEQQAASLVANTPQVSIEETIAAQREIAAMNRENALQASEDAVKLTTERTADLNKILLENKINTFSTVFGKDFGEFVTGIMDSTEGTRDKLGEISETAEGRLGGIFDDVRGLSEQFLSGGITEESQKFMSDLFAESAFQKNLFGEARDLSEARHFGQLVEDRQLQGAQLAGQAGNLAIQEASLLAGLEAGINDVNRLMATMPDALVPTADPLSIFAAESNRLAGASLIDPTSAFSTLGGLGQFNASTQFDALLSQINVGMDMYSSRVQQNQNEAALKAQKQGQWMDLAGTIIGAGSQMYKPG